ncbi:hypothetical protein [Halobaculum litoreum]|uniref:hypothetical protein n=1 Tax=Halobaculum litoreum TaxID=3031998 RepID=UPI0024C2C950|nr:hypothetical protein [Halobaculum sp. DT92]
MEGKSRDERVTPALIAGVREPAMESIRRYNVERLDTPHRLLKHMIDDAGEIRAGEPTSSRWSTRTRTVATAAGI